MTISPEEIARLRALEAGRCDPRLSHEFRAAMAFPALPGLLDEIERLQGMERERDACCDNYQSVAHECERLRADLREAVALLRSIPADVIHCGPWTDRRDALLAKHKEEA